MTAISRIDTFGTEFFSYTREAQEAYQNAANHPFDSQTFKEWMEEAERATILALKTLIVLQWELKR